MSNKTGRMARHLHSREHATLLGFFLVDESISRRHNANVQIRHIFIGGGGGGVRKLSLLQCEDWRFCINKEHSTD